MDFTIVNDGDFLVEEIHVKVIYCKQPHFHVVFVDGIITLLEFPRLLICWLLYFSEINGEYYLSVAMCDQSNKSWLDYTVHRQPHLTIWMHNEQIYSFIQENLQKFGFGNLGFVLHCSQEIIYYNELTDWLLDWLV